MDSSTYNTVHIEKDCHALGELFQQIINDMKASSPIWDDFLGKATKLHSALRTTLFATSAFLDAFQKVADLATNTKGATKEMGSSLTRLCIRHRSIEKKLKDFTCAISEVMVMPLQEKKEEWKTRVIQLDKEHTKEQKKARSEIKKVSSDTMRLQKKLKKGKNDIQGQLNTALQDVTDKFLLLEETEKNAVRQALMEQRSQFCQFLYNFKPIVDGEISMMSEMGHLQEILDALSMQAIDPNTLPPASEQVINDLKGGDGHQTYTYQTPPSSPSSLGSRKSSMCSMNSLNSSSSGSTHNHSPSHHPRHRPLSQPVPGGATIRLSSISSQDSGFTSQDALYLRPPSPSLLDFRRKSAAQEAYSGSNVDSGGTTPSPSYPLPPSSAVSTWANWPDPPYALKQEAGDDRPHTISTAYERCHARPVIGHNTFEAPNEKGSGPSTPNQYAVPCVKAQGRMDGRPPSLPPPPLLGPRARSKAVATPTIPEGTRRSEIYRTPLAPPPVYVNTRELTTIPGGNEDSAASGGEDENEDETKDFMELSAAMDHLNSCTAALEESLTEPETPPTTTNRLSLQCSSGYGTMTNTPTCSEVTLDHDVIKPPEDDALDATLTPTPTAEEAIIEDFGKYSTMPRVRDHSELETIPQRRPVSMAGMPVAMPTLLRRSVSQTPPRMIQPPVRRNSSVTGAIPVVPPNVPKLPGHDGRNLRSQSESRIKRDSMGSDGDVLPPCDQSSEGEYVNFTVKDDSDRDSVDDLPLPPPPAELLDYGSVKEMNHTPRKVQRSSSIVEKHSDIMNTLNQKLALCPPTPPIGQQPIYAIPQTVSNTPPTSLPQPMYASLQDATIPIYATPYAQPTTKQNSLPVDYPDDMDDITPTGDNPPESFLVQITRGVNLRKTITMDRSAPRI